MKIKFSIFFIIFFMSFNINAEQKKIETIIANGIGTSIQDAAQNAAENALTQAVGSFIDATTMMEKQTVITDGIVSRSKVIKKDIKEYSQGSIQFFEILDTKQTSGIFRITARVDVRIDDFRAYIKELASGTQEISAGLFAQMKTDQDNTEDRLSLIIEKILLPIMAGEVLNIDIKPPMTLNQLYAKYPDHTSYIDNYVKWEQKRSNIAVFVFDITLKHDFFDNMTNIFENVSDSKRELFGWESIEKFAEYGKENTFLIIDNYEKGYVSAKSYVLDGFDREARIYLDDKFEYGAWMLEPHKMEQTIYYGYDDKCGWHNDLIFKIFDANSNVIKSVEMQGCSNRVEGLSSTNEEPQLSLYAATTHGLRKIFSRRNYWLFVELPPDVLEKAARVEMSYVQN